MTERLILRIKVLNQAVFFRKMIFRHYWRLLKIKTSSFDTINSITDRNRVISAMSSGGMNDLDIARYFGISRDEVNIVLNLQKKKDMTIGGNL